MGALRMDDECREALAEQPRPLPKPQAMPCCQLGKKQLARGAVGPGATPRAKA